MKRCAQCDGPLRGYHEFNTCSSCYSDNVMKQQSIKVNKLLVADELELAYRRYMDEGGHSYDPWDLAAIKKDYKDHPEKYDWLIKETNNE